MSRIIIKNLPKTITAKQLEEFFSSKGNITDLQLKYTKSGVFRQFAFIGYKTEDEARSAKDYFNNTYIHTSQIQVDFCANLHDPSKPKPWKNNTKSNNEKEKTDTTNKLQNIQANEDDKRKKSDSIPEELMKDAKFKEFLNVNTKRSDKPVWAEDINLESDENPDNSSSDSDYDTNYHNTYTEDVSEKQNMSSPKKTSKNVEKSFNNDFTVKIRNLPYRCKKKQIKLFFHPLKIKSMRLPPNKKGFGYVQFKSEKDQKQALIKNKGFLDGNRIDVVKFMKKEENTPNKPTNVQTERDKESNLEDLAETGRIYVRNLCFTVTEKDLQDLFSKYGPIADITIPTDFLTRKTKGYAFVTFVFAEHAVKAFSELDGVVFQGRILHLIPAKPKIEFAVDENETNYKKKKEAKMKQSSVNSHNWNILFLGMNAVADVISEKYNVEKSKLLSGDGHESVAVRMALAETEMVMESRKFLMDNGVKLDALSQASAERSKTVIMVKNLPSKTTASELEDVFSKHGTLARVLLPPSGLVALVEFQNPSEAKNAFKKLAFSRFRHLPLYLEWAPIDLLSAAPEVAETDHQKEDTEALNSEVPSEEITEDQPMAGTTVFVKNINFNTTQEDFHKFFKQCGPIHHASISTRIDETGKQLSMGFGFVQFNDRDSAVKALQNLQRSQLDGHSLELKFANRETKSSVYMKKKKYEVKKQLSAKILVRNIPFHSSEKEIRELFSKFGTLKSVRLPRKPDGEYRGFGFVEFHSKDNAERAFNALCHSTHLFGRRLVLEWVNDDAEDIDALREKTAKDYSSEVFNKRKVTKRKLNEDIAMASLRYGDKD